MMLLSMPRSTSIATTTTANSLMPPRLLQSGYSTLEYELAQDKASTLGRLGQEFEAALAALAACPRGTNSDRNTRENLVRLAGHALWRLVVHREACGLYSINWVLRAYGVPSEVYARMTPPPPKASSRRLSRWLEWSHPRTMTCSMPSERPEACPPWRKRHRSSSFPYGLR